jgi:type I restriction enzyme, R subunit
MAKSEYGEDKMIQEDTARILKEELGWTSINAYNEAEGDAALLGRSSRTEVVLTRDVLAALKRINPNLPDTAYTQAMEQVLAHDHSKTLVAINQGKYDLLRNGVLVKYKDKTGRVVDSRLWLIDFKDHLNNDYKVIRELWIRGPKSYTRRPDVLGYVNGLPLVFMELKRLDVAATDAYKKNYRDYRGQDATDKQAAVEGAIESLFHWNQFVVISNGEEAKYGSITATGEHFYQWKRLDEEGPEPKKTEMQLLRLLHGMMHKSRLLDIVENFILFDTTEGTNNKVVARNHQYLGVNRVIARLTSNDEKVKAELAAGQLGVFWHTQGSGKSYSMVFLTEKIHRKLSSAYTFVVVTDRTELDDQIASTYTNCGRANAKTDQAQNGPALRKMLRDENRAYVFGLIQKYNEKVKEAYSEREDIIVISDEAHRSQYGRLALNMRKGLPRAKFLGFTGTPLIEAAERQVTREVFGDYVSIYDFQRAVADGATLPLKYINRGEKLKIIDPKVSERIADYIEEAKQNATAEDPWTDEKEDKLYQKLAGEYVIFTSPTRLNQVAKDFVDHYSERRNAVKDGNSKALMVCIDKITCVKMYDLIAEKWKIKADKLEEDIAAEEALFTQKGKPFPPLLAQKRNRLSWMRECEFCVVVSPEQGEVGEFKKWKNHRGEPLDIAPHRAKITSRDLEREFKKAENPFRVAIVCAMWLTGFDVKSLATLYLDKPMQGHTLMQAIARVNRVGGGKANGLIIDYNGMIKSLRKALATFAQADRKEGEEDGGGDGGQGYLQDEAEALVEYALSVQQATEFLSDLGFGLDEVIQAKGMGKGAKILEAVDLLAVSDERRKTFGVHVQEVQARYRSLFPNPGLHEYDDQEGALNAIYNKLQAARTAPDVSALLQDLYDVVDTAMMTESSPAKTSKEYELSKIDFNRLRAEFRQIKQKNIVAMNLMEKIEERLKAMVEQNPTRVKLYERYQVIVTEYNRDKDAAEVEKVMDDLFATFDNLDEEAKRFQREGLDNEQQLAVFDLLQKDALKPKEREAVKKVATELLDKLEKGNLLMGHLRDLAAKQAQLRLEIENHLWANDLSGMGYTEADIASKTQAVFSHLFATAAAGPRVLH